MFLVNVKVLRRALADRVCKDAEISPAVLALDLLRSVDPDDAVEIEMLVAVEQEKVLVDVVMPDAAGVEGVAPDGSLAEQALARSLHVVGKAP